jgi:hypothetical protein
VQGQVSEDVFLQAVEPQQGRGTSMDQKRSLIGAYIQGTADLVIWLFPAIVTGIVVALAQRALLSPENSRGEKT